jgi:hypothetical protein
MSLGGQSFVSIKIVILMVRETGRVVLVTLLELWQALKFKAIVLPGATAL